MSEAENNNLDFNFKLDPKSAFEGMTLAGKRVFQGPGKVGLYAMFAVQAIVAPLGFIGIYMVGVLLILGKLPDSQIWMVVAALMGGAFGMFVNQVVYRRMARMVCESEFGGGGRMWFDETGVQLEMKASHWRTGWQDVEEVLIGKRSLSIAVSGIVLTLPLSAFVDRVDMQVVYEQIVELFEQGKSA